MNKRTLQIQYSIITPGCREGRGVEGAFEEAVSRARRAYMDAMKGYGQHRPDFHWRLSVAWDPEVNEAPHAANDGEEFSCSVI